MAGAAPFRYRLQVCLEDAVRERDDSRDFLDRLRAALELKRADLATRQAALEEVLQQVRARRHHLMTGPIESDGARPVGSPVGRPVRFVARERLRVRALEADAQRARALLDEERAAVEAKTRQCAAAQARLEGLEQEVRAMQQHKEKSQLEHMRAEHLREQERLDEQALGRIVQQSLRPGLFERAASRHGKRKGASS